MGTTYYCDVCKEKVNLERDMADVFIDKRHCECAYIITGEFDICAECAKKMFKSVKEWRTVVGVKDE